MPLLLSPFGCATYRGR
nr:hydroxyisourate hydrolase [Roseovarius sp. 217]